MIKRFLLILILLPTLLLSGCSKPKLTDLKFYVVNRQFLTQDLSDNQIISTAQKNGRLAFEGDNISGYNWETHTVTLKDCALTSYGAVTKESGGSAIFKVDDTFAFVIAINNKLIYYGGFIQGSKNPDVPLQPFIKDNDLKSFKIDFDNKYATQNDVRGSSQLYTFLNEMGLLSSKIN